MPELVGVIAHTSSLTACVLAAVYRDDDTWIGRETDAAWIRGHLPALVDVLTGIQAVEFVDTFVSDCIIEALKRREVGTIAVVVVDGTNGVMVLIADLMARPPKDAILS